MADAVAVRERLLARMDGEICRHAWGDRDAAELLETLCTDIGPRPAGGEGMRRARVLLAARLARLGAAGIREEPVAVRHWRPGEAVVELRAPRVQPFLCGQYLFTVPIDAELPLLDAGGGSPDEIARVATILPGHAVLMDGHIVSGRKYVAIRQRIDWACRAGAAAVITRSTPATGLPALDVAGMADEAPVACFSVSREGGAEMAAAARAGGARVYLRATGRSEAASCANLLADLGPEPLPREMLILGAHLDSYWNAPGAGDNLTGVVTMLEVARVLAPFRRHFRRVLRLVAYTAEEIGCLGSRAYVDAHRAELARVPLVMNMDTLFPSTARGLAVMWSPEMRDYCDGAFRQAGRQVDVRDLFCMSSDYFPFMLAGLPAMRPADWEDALPIEWHSAADDLGHIRVDWVQHNAMVHAQLLARLLTDPRPLPARRLAGAEVAERLAAEEIDEWMRAQGYPWPPANWEEA